MSPRDLARLFSRMRRPAKASLLLSPRPIDQESAPRPGVSGERTCPSWSTRRAYPTRPLSLDRVPRRRHQVAAHCERKRSLGAPARSPMTVRFAYRAIHGHHPEYPQYDDTRKTQRIPSRLPRSVGDDAEDLVMLPSVFDDLYADLVADPGRLHWRTIDLH